MRRLLLALVLVPLTIAAIVWGGFRIWLGTQPEDFQAMIHGMSTSEFFQVVWNEYVPRDVVDRAGYGRETVPGRGHAPWVLRANLDGHARMVLLALDEEHWLAMHAPTGAVRQFWKGEVHFTGPVYDTYHGNQPWSSGEIYLRSEPSDVFRVHDGQVWQGAEVRALGHDLADEARSVELRYSVGSGRSSALVTLAPELRRDDAGRVGVELRARVAGLPSGLRIAMVGPGDDEATELLAGERVFTRFFDEAQLVASAERAAPEGRTRVDNWIENSDCLSCHSPSDRIAGPSWNEIALRYADEEKREVVARLARRVREGGTGEWGQAVMPPHPALTAEASEAMVESVLSHTDAPYEPLPVEVAARERFEWTWEEQPGERPTELHPSLERHRLDREPFTPMVGALSWLPDDRLAVATWDRDGAVFAIRGWRDPSGEIEVERIAEGLQEPLGLATVDGDLYVMQKQEITRLLDLDGDGRTDRYETLSDDWQTSANFHEFGLGLVERDGFLFGALSACVEHGGASCAVQVPGRGEAFRVALATGELELIASGLRTPNGFGVDARGDVFITDNQGDWLPASKLLRLREGAFYGWRAPADVAADLGPIDPPALWLPQNEIGNSPTQPLFLSRGPYAGHAIWGDVYNGGLKRGVLEEVNGVLQGVAFHWSGGLAGGANRLLEGPNGEIVVGEIGNPGNWGDVGKDWFGLEVLVPKGQVPFEIHAVRATPGGFSVEFSEPVSNEVATLDSLVTGQHWTYVLTDRYGGPKYDPQPLVASKLRFDASRTRMNFEVAGLTPGRVVYLHFEDALQSASGEPLWVNEAWYTLNSVPASGDAIRAVGEPVGSAAAPAVATGAPNTLTPEERAAGWRLLFDGQSFDGWRNYGAPAGEPIEGWAIEDGALRMTRATGELRFMWNFINPFSDRPLLDLMTEEKFGPYFELSIDWKIAPGGNSGIFYLVPDDTALVPWKLGLEMQVLDDDLHSDGQIDKHRAGDLYDLVESRVRAARPVGEWNTARIRVDGGRIRHWLNDVPIVDVRRDEPSWDALIAGSKFSDREGYGKADQGHVTLQDHGDTVWYRNLKVREFAPNPTASPTSPTN